MKKQLITYFLLIISTFSFAQKDHSYALAENYFRNGEYQKASTLYKKLVNRNPHNSTYLSKLVNCYQQLNQFDTAEALIIEKISKKQSLTYLNVLLGYNYERQQKNDLATKYYKKAISSLNTKSNYGVTTANIFKNYNKLDYAIQAYKKVTEKNENANYSFQIAQIHGEQGDFQFMFDAYIDYLDKNEKLLNNVKRYTSKYITDDSENENNILFKKALLRKSASNPKNIWNDLLAWLFINQKQYDKAFIQKKALFNRNPDYLSGIKDLGYLAFENKDYETAKECFSFIKENTMQPSEKFVAIHMNLLTDIETKEENLEQQFQSIFSEYGINKNTFPIQIAYADYLTFNKDNPEKARVILDNALQYSENRFQKANVKLKLADVLVYQGKFNKALIYYSQIQTQLTNHYLGQKARFKVAQTSYFKNDFTWSKAQLKVLKGSATQLIANDAADLFLIISDNEPKDSIPSGLGKYAQADLLAFQNKNKESILIINNILKEHKGQSIEDEALFKQAGLYLKQQNFKQAISNYENIIALDIQGILVDDSYYKLAELYNNELNDLEKASKYYQKIIFDHPSSIYLVDARKKFRKLRGDSI